jgi:hypothetical protein
MCQNVNLLRARASGPFKDAAQTSSGPLTSITSLQHDENPCSPTSQSSTQDPARPPPPARLRTRLRRDPAPPASSSTGTSSLQQEVASGDARRSLRDVPESGESRLLSPARERRAPPPAQVSLLFPHSSYLPLPSSLSWSIRLGASRDTAGDCNLSCWSVWLTGNLKNKSRAAQLQECRVICNVPSMLLLLLEF